ncbi:hypothetical protein [Pseudomonas sp. MWU16-30323]|uniref:hypothetical protein n=1 Tax=Pseudomonas sp. MWU16-30323 TaxID=2878094 RepID=UPI001CF9C175|nr:hypothetical protein [Pseudomonas sp. MWU16-30323]
MAAGDVHVKTIEIALPSGQLHTNALYKNGRHQCRVNLLVVKEVEQQDGTWKDVPLSKEETYSATVTAFGGPSLPLPSGWSCDHDKNKYDTGLRTFGSEPSAEIIPAPVVAPIELIPRYLRCSPGTPSDTQRFMGSIVVGGKVYTTNSNNRTYVEITPVTPYVLKASDLTLYMDADAYAFGGSKGVDVDVYYYTPPSGITFLDNLGLLNPVPVNNEGQAFETSYVWHVGNHGIRMKGGVIRASSGAGLRMDMVQRGVTGSPSIRFSMRPTIMRAIRFRGWIDTRDGDNNSPWRLWDNFGCEHVFYIGWLDDRNVLQLRS